MASLNKVTLIGNLGADPEVRFTGSGQAIANLRIATTEKYKDVEKTEWHKVVAFGKTAELCKEYLSKGRQIYVEGRLQTRSWDDKKDGTKKYTTEIVAMRILFLGSAPAGARSARPQASTSSSSPDDSFEVPMGASSQAPDFPADDDIPF